MAGELDHFYRFGDVYATLDTCEELEMLLNRLQRQRLVGEQDWTESKRRLTEIRTSLEGILAA